MPKSRRELARRRRFAETADEMIPPPPRDTIPGLPNHEALLHDPSFLVRFEKGAQFMEERPELCDAFQRVAMSPTVEDARFIVDAFVREKVLELDKLEDMADHLAALTDVFVTAVGQARADARSKGGAA